MKILASHFGERLDIREISDIAAAGEKDLTCRECQFPEEFDLESISYFKEMCRVRF